MKTGKVAKLFGIDPKTVATWVEEFAEFFSSTAQGEGVTQRSFSPEDLIVLNTIKGERTARVEAETIRAKLAAGYRDTTLPPQAPQMDRDNALAVYGQLKVLQAQLEDERNEKQLLREELKQERETNARLNQEVGKWRALYEMLSEQLDDEK